MRSKAKWSLLLSIVLVLSLVLSACSGSKNSDSKKSGDSNALAKDQVLNAAIGQDIPTLDPTQQTDTTSGNVLQMVNAGLTRMHNDKYEFDMAAGEPKANADKTEFTFTLRDGIKWSDGKPVTAQDFVYGWQHENDPASKPAYNFLYASVGIKNASKIQNPKDPMYGKVQNLGIKATDDKTVVVTLDKPAPPFFLSILSQPQFYPLREDFIKAQGKNYAQDADKVLYNGPFVLQSWDHGKGWTYAKNKNYWNAKNIKLSKINVKVVKELATRVNLYKTGKIDTVFLSGDFIDSMKASNPKEFHTGMTSGTFFLYINQKTNKNFKNLNLRKAVNLAINKKDFVDVLMKDGSNASNYVVPKGFVKGPDGQDFRATADNDELKGSATDAKAYWEKAKKELGIKTLNINFLTPDGDSYKKWDEYIADQLQTNLKGVKVTINQQPWGNYLKLNQDFKFDLAFSGWFPDYQDPMTYLDMWTTDQPQNTTGWSNKKFDSLIKSAYNEKDPAKRWKYLQDAESVMLKDAPIVPMIQGGEAWVQKTYVKGIDYPLYGPQVDYTGVTITKH
ncbi:peptide ABC transporter substrate-binding protein [Terrilactibacillus laevilacticus]|uniref:Peptide ABC transporter substrate-binding protein n=1 Tax=Terrilactibacillus laevilacticus TaxID=1380157 RepID=A0ABW5PQH1_9BACI|nr:peptide ABC transporter substrate-binding protein [Terrilactibacillus laevilacticus]